MNVFEVLAAAGPQFLAVKSDAHTNAPPPPPAPLPPDTLADIACDGQACRVLTPSRLISRLTPGLSRACELMRTLFLRLDPKKSLQPAKKEEYSYRWRRDEEEPVQDTRLEARFLSVFLELCALLSFFAPAVLPPRTVWLAPKRHKFAETEVDWVRYRCAHVRYAWPSYECWYAQRESTALGVWLGSFFSLSLKELRKEEDDRGTCLSCHLMTETVRPFTTS